MANLSWKRIGTDAAGYVCVLGSLAFGWLPGPGGIPLLLTGLGLLSIYNPWAKRLLGFVRKHSESLRHLLFPSNRWINAAWDIVTLGLAVGATSLFMSADGFIWKGFSAALYCMSFVIILFNRNRIRWFQKKR